MRRNRTRCSAISDVVGTAFECLVGIELAKKGHLKGSFEMGYCGMFEGFWQFIRGKGPKSQSGCN